MVLRDLDRGGRRGRGVRLHQRVPRRRERDRDLGVDARPDPARRADHGRGHELRGALLGQKVARPWATGPSAPQGSGHGLVIVLCGLLGAITWNLITWLFGLPSSSSHALIGGLVGAALAAGAAVHWAASSTRS